MAEKQVIADQTNPIGKSEVAGEGVQPSRDEMREYQQACQRAQDNSVPGGFPQVDFVCTSRQLNAKSGEEPLTLHILSQGGPGPSSDSRKSTSVQHYGSGLEGELQQRRHNK
jgi:hypothetical protein